MKLTELFTLIPVSNPARAVAKVLISGQIAILISLGAWGFHAFAQPASAKVATTPGAPHLLPHDTLAYFRIDNVDQMREDFGDSSLGRMLADPKMKLFASDFFQTLRELYVNVEPMVGVDLDELLAIPCGQVAAAAFPRTLSDEEMQMVEQQDEGDESEEAIRRRINQKRRAQSAIGGMFIVDAGRNIDNLMKVIEGIEERVVSRQGYVRRDTLVEGTTVVSLLPQRTGRSPIEYFEKDGCVVFGFGHGSAADALDRWLDRDTEPSFAENVDFTAVMGRSIGAEETQPQVTFYADPYHFVERMIKRGGSAAIVWPIFQDLGIGKIRGIGGSVFRGGELFDDISHLHMLIDPPRDGIFGVVRPENVNSLPPNMVPDDVTTYLTVQWDYKATFDNFSRIIDRFQGDGTAKRLFEDNVKSSIGVDVREEIIGNLTGRYLTYTWMEPPARLNSQCRLHAMQIKDPTKAEETLKQFMSKAPNMTPIMIGTHTLYSFEPRQAEMPAQFRRPQLGAMILGDWLMFCDSRQLMERSVRAEGGAMKRLLNVPEFELVSSELGAKLAGEKPFMVSFLRGSDFFRQMFLLAESEDSQKFLRTAAETNPVAAKFYALMNRGQLPKFSDFEKYFAPSGSFAYDEPAGIHFTSFTLKAD